MKPIHIYLAGPIFTERDRNFNALIRDRILAVHPDVDLYLAQDNQTINNNTRCATSIDIYVGDIRRLKQSDLVITIMSGDMPPIGSSYECAYYSSFAEKDINKKIIALYDDCREGSHTYSEVKTDAMLSGMSENQWPYVNLLAVGFVKRVGEIYFTSDEFIEAACRQIQLLKDERQSGIYKITNLYNNLFYIGQATDFQDEWNLICCGEKPECAKLYSDMTKVGLDYFKFDILEKCDVAALNIKQEYWIDYYDAYNLGYNESADQPTTHVFAYHLDGTFAQDYCSIMNAVYKCGLKSNDIMRCVAFNDSHHRVGDFMWRLEKEDSIPAYVERFVDKQVFIYDARTRRFIRGFIDAAEASKLLGCKQNDIIECITGARKLCGGFIWSDHYYEVLPLKYNKITTAAKS